MSGGSDPRALREMIREAARDEVPDLAWDRIESRIFAELDDVSSAPSAARSASPLAGAEAGLAVGDPVFVSRPLQGPAGHLSGVSAGVVAATREVAAHEIVLPALQEHAPRSSRWARWAGAVAVAAAVAGLWISHDRGAGRDGQVAIVAEPIDPEKIPFAPGMDGSTRDLSYLHAGDVVEAAVGPLAFGQQGSMQWTLAAGSRLVVREGLTDLRNAGGPAMPHVVELENGSMRGSVAVGTSAQLVIAAGQTEVMSMAAGSIFSVTRSSRRVVVHLEVGSATVGPLSTGASPPGRGGRYLEAPLLASFSLDGGNTFELIADAASLDPLSQKLAQAPEQEAAADDDAPSPDRATQPSASRVAGPPAASAKVAPPASASASVASAAAVDAAAPPAATLSTSALRSSLVGCLVKVRNDKQKSAPDGVRIQVASTLSVKVADDGSVKSAVFNPPLTPELQSCAVFVFRSKLEPGARVVSIPVNLP